MMKTRLTVWLTTVAVIAGIGSAGGIQNQDSPTGGRQEKVMSKEGLSTAIFAGGCFWCVEAVFEELAGVESVESGYIGGDVDQPSYEAVCTGLTGHAEACRIVYDPNVITYEKLLEVFFRTHDPTQLNRQGNDVGTQYRSAIFYENDQQKETAARIIKALDDSGAFSRRIVTKLEPATKFYLAERYHQDYFRKNPTNAYCRAVIPPKLNKLKKVFADELKSKQ